MKLFGKGSSQGSDPSSDDSPTPNQNSDPGVTLIEEGLAKSEVEADVDLRADRSLDKREDEHVHPAWYVWTRRILAWIGTLLAALLIVVAWPAALGGFFTWTVVSGISMEPTLYQGDLVLGVRQPGGYEIGQTIIYRLEQDGHEGNVIHRIVAINPDGTYVTKGDNRELPDSWAVQPDWIRGRLLYSFPGGSRVLLLIRSPFFWIIPFALLVIRLLWPEREEDEEEEPREVEAGEGAAPEQLSEEAVAATPTRQSERARRKAEKKAAKLAGQVASESVPTADTDRDDRGPRWYRPKPPEDAADGTARSDVQSDHPSQPAQRSPDSQPPDTESAEPLPKPPKWYRRKQSSD